jgi:hypothetical protein
MPPRQRLTEEERIQHKKEQQKESRQRAKQRAAKEREQESKWAKKGFTKEQMAVLHEKQRSTESMRFTRNLGVFSVIIIPTILVGVGLVGLWGLFGLSILGSWMSLVIGIVTFVVYGILLIKLQQKIAKTEKEIDRTYNKTISELSPIGEKVVKGKKN